MIAASIALAFTALAVWAMLRPWRMLWLIMAVAILYPPTIEQIVPLGGKTFSSIYLIVEALAALGIARCRRDGPIPGWVFLPLTVLIVPLLSATLSGQWGGLVDAEKPLLAAALMGVYIAVLGDRYRDKVSAAIRALPWIGVGCAAFAALQYVSGTWLLYEAVSLNHGAGGFAGRAAATFGHPTIYGFFAVIAAVVAVQLRQRWWPALFAVNTIGIVLSGSRSAAVALAVGVLGALFLARRRRKASPRQHAAGWFAVAALVATAPLYMNSVGQVLGDVVAARFADASASTSFLAHEVRRDAAWDYITSDPVAFLVGHGPRGAVTYLTSTSLGDNESATFDNSYLTLWVDYGIVGLGVLLFVALWALRRCRQMVAPMAAIAVSFYAFDFQQWTITLMLVALFGGYALSQRQHTEAEATEPVTASVG